VKDYPLRNTNDLFDVCECGHLETYHVIRSSHNTKCEKCVCPKYKFELKMHLKKYDEMIELIDEKKRIQGNSV